MQYSQTILVHLVILLQNFIDVANILLHTLSIFIKVTGSRLTMYWPGVYHQLQGAPQLWTRVSAVWCVQQVLAFTNIKSVVPRKDGYLNQNLTHNSLFYGPYFWHFHLQPLEVTFS